MCVFVSLLIFNWQDNFTKIWDKRSKNHLAHKIGNHNNTPEVADKGKNIFTVLVLVNRYKHAHVFCFGGLKLVFSGSLFQEERCVMCPWPGHPWTATFLLLVSE